MGTKQGVPPQTNFMSAATTNDWLNSMKGFNTGYKSSWQKPTSYLDKGYFANLDYSDTLNHTLDNFDASKLDFGNYGTQNYDFSAPIGMGTGGNKGSSWMDNMGQWGQFAEGLAGLGGVYVGMKQYGLAEDQFKSAQEMDARNYAAQKAATNLALEHQYRAMQANNGGRAPEGYASLSDYMNKHGIKG